MPRVEIPKRPLELIDLAEKVYAKHQQDADNSALKPLPWTEVGVTLTQAEELHIKAEKLKREMDQVYEERDKLLKPIEEIVKSSRDILIGVHKKQPKKLGEWGYIVIESPKSTGEKTEKSNAN